MIGQLLDPAKNYKVQPLMEANAVDGTSYTLGVSPNHEPMVFNKKTKRWWAVNWNSLLELARSEGIDEPQIILPLGVN